MEQQFLVLFGWHEHNELNNGSHDIVNVNIIDFVTEDEFNKFIKDVKAEYNKYHEDYRYSNKNRDFALKPIGIKAAIYKPGSKVSGLWFDMLN